MGLFIYGCFPIFEWEEQFIFKQQSLTYIDCLLEVCVCVLYSHVLGDQACVCLSRPWKGTQHSFFHSFSFETASLSLELTLVFFFLCPSQRWAHRCIQLCLAFYSDIEDLSSGPYAYIASTLTPCGIFPAPWRSSSSSSCCYCCCCCLVLLDANWIDN